LKGTDKAIPVQAWTVLRVPGVEAPRFEDNRHIKLEMSAYVSAAFTSFLLETESGPER